MATGNAIFQTCILDWAKWNKNHLEACRLVAQKDINILGWAMLSPSSGQCVYAGVAEVSIYVDKEAQGNGIACLLLNKLINGTEENGIWTLEAGIFP